MLDVLTIGDIKMDAFIQVPKAHVICRVDALSCEMCISHGKKIPIECALEMQIAGSAPNVAVGLAKSKKKTAVLSAMGDDATYKEALSFLKSKSVSTRYIYSYPKQQSSFSAVLNYQGESTQLVSHMDREMKIPAKLPKCKWIQISEFGKGYEKAFRRLATLKNVKICFNPGALQINEKKKELYDLIENTSVLIVNRVEAHLLLHKEKNGSLSRLVKELRELGSDIVVITDGKKGACSYDGKEVAYAPMFPGKRKEATGAGDSFMTGFLSAIMSGKDHKTGLAWGSVNAAEVVQHVGPTKGLLSVNQIQKRLRENKKYKVTVK